MHRLRLETRVVVARAYQSIGWPGFLGVLFLIAATALFTAAWSAHTGVIQAGSSSASNLQPLAGGSPPPSSRTEAQPSPWSTRAKLSNQQDVLALITQIENAALSGGLGWASAEYRVVPTSETRPASLEVRCTFRAPYPNVRRMLADLLTNMAGATLRELTVTRPTSDVVDVDAKLTIAVLLQEGTASASGGMSGELR